MNLVNKQRPCANNVQNRDVVGQTSMTAPIEGNCTRARRVCNRAKASRCTQTPGTHSLPQLQSVRSLRNFRSAFNCADLQKPEGASGWYSRRRFHCGLMHIVELVTFRGKRQGNLVLWWTIYRQPQAQRTSLCSQTTDVKTHHRLSTLTRNTSQTFLGDNFAEILHQFLVPTFVGPKLLSGIPPLENLLRDVHLANVSAVQTSVETPTEQMSISAFLP